MIEVNDLRRRYRSLYSNMMRYTWNFATIKLLADLEVACHTSCTDIDTIRHILDGIQSSVRYVISDDEDLKESLEQFYDEIEDHDSTYVKLETVKEVVQ